MILPDRVLHGGDYNPEQWDYLTIDTDLDAFEAADVNTLTLNVFGWSALQPRPDTFTFERLDAVLDRVHERGLGVILGTATPALPPWLVKAEPTTMRVDFQGLRHGYGQRHNFCPTSTVYRSASQRLARVVAERYHEHPALLAWHIGNEYGGVCYCEDCVAGFRQWLLGTHGSLEQLNHDWCTQVWSHILTDVDEIPAPNGLTEHWGGPYRSGFPIITLEYKRYMTEQFSACLEGEITQVRRVDGGAHPVTTNLMGAYEHLDYYRFARELDVVSWDNYPRTERAWPEMAFQHALMRAVAPGKPLWLMEQAPVSTTCRTVNPSKGPGVMGRWSHQAVAQGSDAVLCFQMRTAPGGSEMWFGGVLDHRGRTDTRTYHETQVLGADLARLGDLVGSRVDARAAVVMDWDSWWYSKVVDGHSDHLTVPTEAQEWHEALARHVGGVDVTDGRSDLSGYDLVVAAGLYMAHDDVIDALGDYVAQGGTLVVGPRGFATASTGRVLIDERVDELLGCEVEETDAREPHVALTLTLPDGSTDEARHTFEILRPTGAEVVGTWTSDWLAGTPAVTRHAFGRGTVVRLGASLTQAGRHRLLSSLVAPSAGHPLAGELEHTSRTGERGTWDILLNHGTTDLLWSAPAALTDVLSGEHLPAGASVLVAAGAVRYLRRV
ncbi:MULTISPECIES: beta-galactosidase [unclassified Actinomyces]|uniref:beta-galactosidase n=1 Tax=unclassified Actinomyces TaxID=2609248 RepID=UPI0020178DBC|nr:MULTISPECIES: beta-galactosidase [unclassified Actinomyces]MCL3777162.1 beta-galactosidase [Actinomyces sp. AC-20-1]MCL3789014.1 beta-galactosidase [Actinomyces sp. 187325]MCL3791369.1 beta-galactosidase [Actinomyces sp. 186855]MCL3793920.1 beta-galactosidase [Actinomyces sp. 217892]